VQLTAIIRQTADGGWTIAADIGEPGADHARAVGPARAVPLNHETASLIIGLIAGASLILPQVAREFAGPGRP
jgi:hypothetical protein